MKRCDCRLLPSELVGECIDFRLALGSDGGKIGTVTAQEGYVLRALATVMSRSALSKRRDQRCHLADDLTLDDFDLVACLTTSFFQPAQFHSDMLP